MSRRTLWMIVFVAMLVAGLLLVRSCQRDARAPAAGTGASSSGPSVAIDPPRGRSAESGPDTAGAAASRRDEAIRAAVDTVHRYLAALGSDDRAKADAFWVNGKPPAASGEAGMRELGTLRALRIDNGTPTQLDTDAVPAALEVPVSLRASIPGKPVQRYTGVYRVRQAITGDRWEITSASLDAVPPR